MTKCLNLKNEKLHIGTKGLTVIKHYEKGPKNTWTGKDTFASKMYLCPAGKPSIGWGHVIISPNEDWMRMAIFTLAQADSLLAADMIKYENAVKQYVSVEMTQDEFDACVCFTYNAGKEAFRTSSICKFMNTGNLGKASTSFLLWNKVTNPVTHVREVSNGLVNRRRTEAELFINGTVTFYN